MVITNPSVWVAHAASLSSLSDNVTRIATGVLADHEVRFVTPTGIAAGKTVTLTFGSAFTLGTFAVVNEDFATGVGTNCNTATYTEQTLAASPSGATWGVSGAGQAITLTSGTGTETAGNCIRFRLGANATFNGVGSSFITNGTAGNINATVSVTGTFGDVGSVFIPIIANDQVTLSATVNPTLSFTLSQTALGFGTLTTANGRWATNGGGAAVATTGLVLTASTNGASGYTIYVVGPTLTNVANPSTTIAAMGASATSAPGTAQFGLNGAVGSGTGTISSPYATASQYAYTATTTQTPVATNTVPDPGTTYNISYLANITAVTPAGAYTAVHTWTATANF